jgi:hypothetical protein
VNGLAALDPSQGRIAGRRFYNRIVLFKSIGDTAT